VKKRRRRVRAIRDDVLLDEPLDPTGPMDPRRVAPAWGWRRTGGGRASHVGVSPEYQGTTSQVCGLYPFVAGSGAPHIGVPIGRHMHWGQVVSLEPFSWLASGLVTNPGIFVLGQPGVGKSSIGKRLMTGMCAYGIHPIVLGDVKPDYTRLVSKLGGQVIRVGRGLDRINPLDSGPLGQAIKRLHTAGHDDITRHLMSELRGRRLALLAALCALGRGHVPVTPGEEVMLGAAIDHLVETLPAGTDPTIHDVLDVIRDEPDKLITMAEVDNVAEFKQDSKFLRQTLRLLVDGSLRGMFDGPTSEPLDLDAPAIDVDLSAIANGGEDTAVAAAMLCTWAYGFGVVDASLALSEVGLAPARNYIAYMDELWRALRGAPGLVDRADTLTRVNRQKGMAQIMMTHSLADLEALPTPEDRAKAKGFVERCSVTILGGLPPRELDAVAEVVGQLSLEERRMVSSWSTPTSWTGGEAHPGRGKYLIKAGMRSGIPVEMEYVADEADLYDTDAAAVATVTGLSVLRTRNVIPTEVQQVEVELSGETGSLADLTPDETDIGQLDIDVPAERRDDRSEPSMPVVPMPADPRAPVPLAKRPYPTPAPASGPNRGEMVAPLPGAAAPAPPPAPPPPPPDAATSTIDLDDPYGPGPAAARPPMDTGAPTGNDEATGPGTSGDERSDPDREAVR
jgi:hypothetical protein